MLNLSTMKNTLLIFSIVFSLTLSGQVLEEKIYKNIQLDSIFEGNLGTFVLHEMESNIYQLYNFKRAKQAFEVHSTSKIFWSIIGLEENIITNENDIVIWDSTKHPRKQWWPKQFTENQTAISALRYSVNWYYMDLLESMNPEMIEKYMNSLQYQPQFKVEGVHYFGLTYNIKKSAFEQINFLKQLYKQEFNLKPNTYNTIKKGMLIEKTEKHSLYARTGLGPTHNDKGIGWLIGYIEKETKTYFYAFNVENENEGITLKLRNSYPKRIFRALQLLE